MVPKTTSKKQRQKSDYAEKQLRETDLKTHLGWSAKMPLEGLWVPSAQTVANKV
jgi:hypothetical protein